MSPSALVPPGTAHGPSIAEVVTIEIVFNCLNLQIYATLKHILVYFIQHNYKYREVVPADLCNTKTFLGCAKHSPSGLPQSPSVNYQNFKCLLLRLRPCLPTCIFSVLSDQLALILIRLSLTTPTVSTSPRQGPRRAGVTTSHGQSGYAPSGILLVFLVSI